MFTFPELYKLDVDLCQSRICRHEPEAYFPVAVPPGLGKLLEARDSKVAPKFQIFHYPTHSEVWHIDHWNLSVSRKYYILHNSPTAVNRKENRSVHEITKFLSATYPALTHKDTKTGLHKLAAVLAKAPADVIAQIPGLQELLDTLNQDEC